MPNIPVAIKSVSEPWGRVVLENGAIITFRVVLNQVYQIFDDDNKPMQNENGDYMFGINSQTLVGVEKQPLYPHGPLHQLIKKEMN